jgi:DUF1680 family protein
MSSMEYDGGRRTFLKTVVGATGMLARAAQEAQPRAAKPRRAADVRISSTPYTPAEYPIRPQVYHQVALRDTFWRPKVEANARVTIPFALRKFAELDRALSGGVLEAGILSLRTHPDSYVQDQIETRIQQLKQRPGHGNSVFETAAAHYLVTGKRDLLDKAIADAAYLYEDFRLHSPRFSGGERDALNCVQLYRVTGDRKHLDMAKQYLDIRGLEDSLNRSRHNQSYQPVTEQTEAVGHAVNGLTLMVSLVDVGVLTGLDEYLIAGQRMWEDIATSKLYITGGAGSSGNEGFGPAYSLPNISAYCETCAALMFITLSDKLFLATGDAKYIDVMERTMYNNAIDGVSASADHFFYVNRLASAGDGRDVRWQRASLECCPPNLVRFLAGMPGLIYAHDSKGAIYVNLYVSGDTAFQVAGKTVSFGVESEMPWGAKSKITCTGGGGAATLKLRIPGWARNQPVPGSLYSYLDTSAAATRIAVNGEEVAAAPDRFGYVSLNDSWKAGDTVEIEFPLEARRIAANGKVHENRGRMAVERGPIVYCCEWPDAPGAGILNLLFDAKAELTPSWDKDLFGGATVIQTAARSISDPASAPKAVHMIPYHLWANRGPGEMTVWLSTEEYRIGDTGPAGGIIFFKNPNYATDGWRYLEAAPLDQSGGAKWGCFRTAIPGARGTAIGTGRQNTLDMVAACAEPGSAARLCTDLSINGIRGWFLPSEGELDLMYRNLAANGLSFAILGPDNVNYWTSTQQTADMAAHIDFADNGRHHGDDKDFPRRVRAIRAF